MRFTDKQYYMDDRLIKRLNLMINRLKRNYDNLILIDGNEGDGKTNLEVAIAYYMAYVTKRKFTLDHLFFKLDELMTFAMNTEEQIICWDEGALEGLAMEWWKRNQVKFIKLLMVARKKRHIFIICIPKFFKLNEYLVVDRSICLIHVFARHGIERGRFVYFNMKAKEKLFYEWRKTKARAYKKFQKFHGTFPEVLPIIFDEKEYDKKKDAGILSLNEVYEKRETFHDVKVFRLQYRIATIVLSKNFGHRGKPISVGKFCQFLGTTNKTILEWIKHDMKHPEFRDELETLNEVI